ncbi:MAG: hypothetical protein K8W52_20920 [Deltaproteobacteria bacterium]|nr:hypothetical protein [Deltaproteobacteria bacterium]
MIPRVRGWISGRDGDAVVQFPQGGGALEGVRYLERRRPAMPALELVRGLPLPADAIMLAISPPRAIVTDEGEYATLISTEIAYQGAAVHRAIGIVHVDDFDAVTIGHIRRPEAFAACDALVEELVRADRHHMPVRRRPYRCALPPGWQPEAQDWLTTTWRAPTDARAITPLPALPLRPEDPAAALEALLGLSGIRTSPTPFTARGGLCGERWTVRGPDALVDLALALDDRFTYAAAQVRHDDVPDAGEFAALLATIEPIPRDRSQRRDVTTFAHLTD